MAILKIISHGKTNKAKMQLLKYVLNPKKTKEELCYVSGDYQMDCITAKNVYHEFRRIRELFGKENTTNSRTYTHGTIAFSQGEISPDKVRDFVSEFVEKVYPKHQVLVAVHTDTNHPHAHFLIEPVSFVDGRMLHTSKKDLERAKSVCNEMCLERSLSVAKKGHHYDGSKFEIGDVTAWTKDKYHMLLKSPRKAYLAELAYAVKTCLKVSKNQAEFCRLLENEYGWSVIWKDSKKNITFVDAEGHRVRDTNLNKTFNFDISKESLSYKFSQSRISELKVCQNTR